MPNAQPVARTHWPHGQPVVLCGTREPTGARSRTMGSRHTEGLGQLVGLAEGLADGLAEGLAEGLADGLAEELGEGLAA